MIDRAKAAEFVGWLAAWAVFKRPAWFHWLLIPAFLALGFGVVSWLVPVRRSDLTAGFLLIHRIIHSPYGQVLKAIRDNEARAISLGYDAERYKLLAFVLSATLAGLAKNVRLVAVRVLDCGIARGVNKRPKRNDRQ